ncbi:hypothetical protein KHQ82_08945 [Mycoplasmatota bacterium]|nr:hypothetical protein KHQ82_08945 [Mycoplasmatota bacterium]
MDISNKNIEIENIISKLLSSLIKEEDALTRISNKVTILLNSINRNDKLSDDEYFKLKRSIENLLKALSIEKMILEDRSYKVIEFANKNNYRINISINNNKDILFSKW